MNDDGHDAETNDIAPLAWMLELIPAIGGGLMVCVIAIGLLNAVIIEPHFCPSAAEPEGPPLENTPLICKAMLVLDKAPWLIGVSLVVVCVLYTIYTMFVRPIIVRVRPEPKRRGQTTSGTKQPPPSLPPPKASRDDQPEPDDQAQPIRK